MRIYLSLLSFVLSFLIMPTVGAITYPSTTPTGEIGSGTFNSYFTNMYRSAGFLDSAPNFTYGCANGQVVRGFTTTGILLCTNMVLTPLQYWRSTDAGVNIYFTGAGNVGIGIATTTAKLQVASSNYAMHLGEGIGGAGIDFKNRLTTIPNSGTLATIAWLESTSGLPAGSLLLSSRPGVGGVALVATGSTANLYVSPSSGNVGIGTIAPGAKLDVAGNVNLGNIGSTTAYNNSYLVYGGIGNNNYGTDLGFNNGRYSTRLFAPTTADITFGSIPTATLPTLQSQFSTLMTIRGDTGNIGIGTATPTEKLDVAGSINYTGGLSRSEGTITQYDNLLSWSINTPNQSGALKINLPKTWSNTMLRIEIDGYDYSTAGAWKTIVSGYNYAAGSYWANTSTEIQGRVPFTQVRLAHDGINNVIILGNTGTIWQYPKIVVKSVMASYSNQSGWDTGWSAGLITDESAITGINSPSIPMYTDGSNDVGIGTVTPGAKLEINSGVAGFGGLRFTQLNSSSTPMTANGRALSLTASGDLGMVDIPLTGGDNLLENGDFEYGVNGWTAGGSPTTITGAYAGDSALQITGSAVMTSNEYIPVDPTRDTYQLEVYIKKSVAGTTPGLLYFGYAVYNANKVLISTSPCGTYCYYAAGAYTVPVDGAYHKFAATTTGEGTVSYNFPVGTRYIRVLGLINYTGTADSVTLIDHVTLKRLTSGPVLVGNNYSTTNLIDQQQASRLYTTAANNLIIQPPLGGNVGISTTVVPISPLQINGTLTVGGGGTASIVGNMQLRTGGASPISNRLTYGTDGTGWKFAIGKNQAGGVTDQLVIQDNGNVGIGVISPSSKLEIGGGEATNESRIVFAASDASDRFTINTDLDVTTGNDTLTFRSFSTDSIFTMNGLGNIGIGISTPGAKLEVAGQIKITGGTPGLNKILTSDATGLASWATLPAWGLTGNAGTVAGTNYIGTTDSIDVVFKRNNIEGMRLSGASGNLVTTADATVNGITLGRGGGNNTFNTANGAYALITNTIGSNNTANGFYALYLNTTGNNNTANGMFTLSSNTAGFQNTANGSYALYLNTTGQYNTANGVQALYLNTTGNQNTANGVNSLYSNTTGGNNTANGMYSLFSNTTGNQNTANGVNSLYSNTIGNSNTVNGFQSLYSNTMGDYNTANGVNSLYSNTVGVYNSANGHSSLYSNTTGNYNTANGTRSLYANTTGLNNTANGVNALSANTTGENNTANGFQSLYSNTTGNQNTSLGYNAGSGITTGSSNITIGDNAQVASGTGSNQLSIGNWIYGTAGNIGIGTSTPSAKLDVTGNTRITGDLTVQGKVITDTIVNRTVTNVSISGSLLPDAVAPLIYRDIGSTALRWNNLYLSGQITLAGGVPGVGKILTSDAVGLASWQANSYTETDPIWIAQKSAYATLLSPVFTGTPTLPTGTIAVTQTAGNSSTAVATTAFVTTADALKANIASPVFTGTPTLPTGTIAVTQTAGNSSTAVATTAFVTTADALKANIASPALTGIPTAPTAALATNTTQLATTAFVNTQIANDAPTKTGTGASGTWGINITGNASTATTASSVPWTGITGSPAFAANATASGRIRMFEVGCESGYGTSCDANTNGRLDLADSATSIAWAGITSKPTTIAGYAITDAVDLTSGQIITGIKYFQSNKGSGSYLGTNTSYALQAYSTDGGAAAMSFHRVGSGAINLGLDPDNVFRLGGWSAPSARWQVDMSGNETVAGSMTAGAGVRALGGSVFNLTNGYSFSGVGDTDGGMFSPADGTVVLATNNAERLRIDSLGNVGVGTSSPASKLQVNGEITSSDLGVGGQFRAVYGNYGSFIRNDGSDTYFLLTASGSPYGAWNTLRPIRINNAVGDVILNSSLYSLASGNVGIGTSTPSAKLDVTGNTRITGDLTVQGKVITDTIVNRTVTNVSISGSLLPDAVAPLIYRDIGSTALRWNNLYLSGTINAVGTITAPTFVGNLTGNATTSTTANSVASFDGDRNAATKLPTTSPQKVRYDFVGAGSAGTAGNYAGVMTYAPWVGNTASTGDASYQLAYGSTAANGGGLPMLNIRKGIDSTWNSWYTLLHSGNYTTYAPSLTGTGASGTWGINITGNAATATTASSLSNANVSIPTTGISYFNGGNVGIGTSTPTNILSVAASVQGNSAVFDGSVSIGASMGGESSNRATLGIRSATSGTGHNAISISNSNNQGIFDLKDDGSLFLGMTSPTAKFEVNGGDALINGITVGLGGGNIATNTANGYRALYLNTTGYYNTANGRGSLNANTTGAQNTANGYVALSFNTTGVSNTANGVSALYNNTTGGYNAANGVNTLYSNIDGNYNTANGYAALQNNTTGWYNTAIGSLALQYNTTGNKNTANGASALVSNSTGYLNTAIGEQALYLNTTGNYNTALGNSAGGNITTGSNNIAIGNSSQVSSATGSNQLSIGNWIYGTAGNIGIGTTNPNSGIGVNRFLEISGPTHAGLVLTDTDTPMAKINFWNDNGTAYFYQNAIGNYALTMSASGNVGIGTSTPLSKLDVNGPIRALGSSIFAQADNSTLNYTAAPLQVREAMFGGNGGYQAPRISLHWGGVVASQIGLESSGRIAILNNPGTGYESLVANNISAVGTVTASNMVNNGWYRSNGQAGWYSETYGGGWWMTDPTWIRSYNGKYLYVDSIIQAGAYMNSPAYYYISDARLKKDLVKITSPLDKITAMNGYYFKWIKDDKKDLGLIAQEVEKIFPDAVGEYTDPDSKKTYKNVEYGHLIAPVIEAIKELATLVKSDKTDIAALKSENESLKKRLDAIEAHLAKK